MPSTSIVRTMASNIPEWTHTCPRDDATSARLTFESGVAPRLDLRGAALGDELARCRFEGDAPRVVASRGELSIDYRGFFRWFFLGRMAPGLIELNDAIPWGISVEGGIARSELDLRTIALTRFEVAGGAASVKLHLGAPKGIVPVRISGGAAKIHITAPPGVAARIKIGGGVSQLDFLEQRLGAVGGGIALESRKWDPKGDGYDIKIGGGAARITIEEGPPSA